MCFSFVLCLLFVFHFERRVISLTEFLGTEWQKRHSEVDASIFFSFHPFTNVGSAVLKLYAIRFATREKANYGAIDHANVFQIQDNVVAVRLEFKKSPQLGHRLSLDSAT
jgi:hypothetical protein